MKSGTIAVAVNSTPDEPQKKENKQEVKARLARRTLCEATIICLDRYGYSETSIGRITSEANVSRGALTHHYKSKEDLIVDTVDRMLQARVNEALPSRKRKSNKSASEIIKRDLLWVWKNLDTREGRALVEVLLASRTDTALQERISEKLHQWNDDISSFILRTYRAKSGRDEDLVRLWDMCRVFFRGLIIQKSFARSRREVQSLAEAFVELVSDGFEPR